MQIFLSIRNQPYFCLKLISYKNFRRNAFRNSVAAILFYLNVKIVRKDSFLLFFLKKYENFFITPDSNCISKTFKYWLNPLKYIIYKNLF